MCGVLLADVLLLTCLPASSTACTALTPGCKVFGDNITPFTLARHFRNDWVRVALFVGVDGSRALSTENRAFRGSSGFSRWWRSAGNLSSVAGGLTAPEFFADDASDLAKSIADRANWSVPSGSGQAVSVIGQLSVSACAVSIWDTGVAFSVALVEVHTGPVASRLDASSRLSLVLDLVSAWLANAFGLTPVAPVSHWAATWLCFVVEALVWLADLVRVSRLGTGVDAAFDRALSPLGGDDGLVDRAVCRSIDNLLNSLNVLTDSDLVGRLGWGT